MLKINRWEEDYEVTKQATDFRSWIMYCVGKLLSVTLAYGIKKLRNYYE